MNDLISRQATITAIDNCGCDGEDSCGNPWIYKENAVETIEMVEPLLPTHPEIIRCKECKHYEDDITGNPWGVCCHKDWIANNVGHDVDENGWCYRAERKEVTE